MGLVASVIPAGMWTALLVVGITASFVTVVMIVGSTSTKRAQPGRPELPPGSLARAIKDTAAARASEANRHHRGLPLTNVRPVEPARPPSAGPGAAGQTPAVPNDHGDGGDGTGTAAAILAHFAEHDPKRIAEVITAWIRADRNSAQG